MIDYRSVDAEFFAQRLDDFLPPLLYDCHVHVSLAEHVDPISEERKRQNWALEVGQELPAAELAAIGSQLFPGRQVRWLCFAFPIRECHLGPANDYVAGAAHAGQIDAPFLVTDPAWDASELRERVEAGGFVGLKPYPDLVRDRPAAEVSIPEFFPPHHRAVAEELGLVVMLHLPRAERLRDRRNIAELRQFAHERPTLQTIVAHIGRAYTLSYAAGSIEQLVDLPNVQFDFAANLNADVLALALRTVGPRRVLYGSDLPITLMHGMREHVGDQYLNYTDGDYSWNTDRKPPEVEATYTLYLYEQLAAFRSAAQAVGLSPRNVEDVFAGNAARLLRR